MNVHHTLLVIKFVIIVWVHLEVVERELLLDALLERLSLFQGQRVRLGNHGNNVDDIGELLEDDDIDWLQTRRWKLVPMFGNTFFLGVSLTYAWPEG